MKKIYLLIISLAAAVMLCSCGPQTTTATLHIDKDFKVTKVVLGNRIAGNRIKNIKEYSDLELTKGDIFTCPVYKGPYGIFVICKRIEDKEYTTEEENYLIAYSGMWFNVKKGESYDLYLSDATEFKVQFSNYFVEIK